MDADEELLLRESLAEIASRAEGAALTNALDAFGWLDLLADDPRAATMAVFGVQGTAGTWSSAFHDVLAASLGELDEHLTTSTAVVVLPAPRATTPGVVDRVVGITVGPRVGAHWYVLANTDADGALSICRFPVGALTATPTHGLDGRLELARIAGTTGRGEVLARGPAAQEWWAQVETAGRRALCQQITGTAARMLDLATEHARQRKQFGVLIGSFQAVRHKLAETYVAVAAASSASEACWDARGVRDSWLAALTAKIVVSQSVTLTISHSQQVLAGMGFTAEHPFHRYMKRALVLDRLLGSASELAPIVGRELVRLGAAPRLVEL
jgi:hypothetical protein